MPAVTSDVLDELAWRGLIAQSTDVDALRRYLASGPATLYYGCDPTAPSLHVGNLVGLLVLRWFQQHGHRPIALAGGATGLIGDPGGRNSERTLLTADQVAAQRRADRPSAGALRRPDPGPRPAGQQHRVDGRAQRHRLPARHRQALPDERDARQGDGPGPARGGGISYTEFSYMLLQSMDYLELFRRDGLPAADRRQRPVGQPHRGHRPDPPGRGRLGARAELAAGHLGDRREVRQVHRRRQPLAGSPSSTSPYAFFQYWVNVDDADVGRYLRYFTFLTREEIEALDQATAERPAAREAQRRLAEEITTLVHGAGRDGQGHRRQRRAVRAR